jgi:hypothetical protein
LAECIARLTAAVTPGSSVRLFSTRATQLEQVIPSTPKTIVEVVWSAIAPSFLQLLITQRYLSVFPRLSRNTALEGAVLL